MLKTTATYVYVCVCRMHFACMGIWGVGGLCDIYREPHFANNMFVSDHLVPISAYEYSISAY